MIGHGCICFYNQISSKHALGDYSVSSLSLICGVVAVIVAIIVFYLYQIHSSLSFIIAFSLLFITTLLMSSVTFIAFIDTYSVRSLVKENTSKMMSLEYEFECCGYKSQREYCQYLNKPTCYSRIVKPFMTFRMLCSIAFLSLLIETISFGIFLCLWFDGLEAQPQDMITLHISRVD
ncbi:hypothetical protein EDI_093040 [Entamoeba dispar SAW760]|uniref:Uncharacterized protein n=1 Tax=Entamoeba dispar (strain ATCC PRA-260 / SAW760) TaxID=370354 RepID=B0ED96_ENTDS|nr:uncharacterized protein EDI_093040 [Entamoeba dispar SAW760]EDR27513.1 hypothetical protein EDI_093040 [Entamoeba dispar SAW760]|eukprot:EDR27513.1 hypothetical protein EDI_093040 [Entamoeba dispar SAW760]